jgi:hypothetical protein
MIDNNIQFSTGLVQLGVSPPPPSPPNVLFISRDQTPAIGITFDFVPGAVDSNGCPYTGFVFSSFSISATFVDYSDVGDGSDGFYGIRLSCTDADGNTYGYGPFVGGSVPLPYEQESTVSVASILGTSQEVVSCFIDAADHQDFYVISFLLDNLVFTS